MSDLQLRFINQSSKAANETVVIFQKNITEPRQALQWQTFENIGIGIAHPFTYPNTLELDVHDVSNGFRQRIPGVLGRKLIVMRDQFGNNSLDYSSNAMRPDLIEVLNQTRDEMELTVFRNSQPVVAWPHIMPYLTVVLEVPLSLFIGIQSGIPDGSAISAADVSCFTDLSFVDVASADIVMYDNNTGSSPYRFALENVTKG